MPLLIPTLDDRRYQDLLNEAIARIPVHNPEWTNFNKSDPGITLLEVFAFLTETLLYRSNQIPERNRRKFLSLLGIPLQEGSSARGIVTFTNERGPLRAVTLNGDLEVRAGSIPFYTQQPLDVLPIEAEIYYKRRITDAPPRMKEYYKQLYSSYTGARPLDTADPMLYETVRFVPRGLDGVDLGQDTIDNSLWIALLVRNVDKPYETRIEDARKQIAGKTISLGIMPLLDASDRRLVPGGQVNPLGVSLLQYRIPKIPPSGGLPSTLADRKPAYQSLVPSSPVDVLSTPGIVQVTLPEAKELVLWNNLDPLESGIGDFPPPLEDTTRNARLITWLRISSSASVRAKLLWVGINAGFVTQQGRVSNELLPRGTGEPDQSVGLSKTPVVRNSVRLYVTANGKTERWDEIDDLTAAGPEVPIADPRLPPGTIPIINRRVKVFAVNYESGEITFGNGIRGARPPFDAILRTDYAFSVGSAGNLGPEAITSAPALPAGIKVTNPEPTWGGTDPETVGEGEQQITRYLQHRDRLVNAGDFETITKRTPGVDIGRVDVLPAFNPELTGGLPGDAPGAVTLMIVPSYDPVQPDAPYPDRLFLDAICEYIEPRRLVTTEVFLRGPTYRGIWITVGIDVVAGESVAGVREAVQKELRQFLSPLPPGPSALDENGCPIDPPPQPGMEKGWPLRKPVIRLELVAVASRVPGVLFVNNLLVARVTGPPQERIPMAGLELPRLVGLSVVVGDPLALDQLRGQVAGPMPGTTGDGATDGGTTGDGTAPGGTAFAPIPVTPEECD